jgi:hypothetical protein
MARAHLLRQDETLKGINMGISSSNPDLMRAILAMDSYNRGYNAGIKSPGAGPNEGLIGTQLGLATINSVVLPQGFEAASFYAQTYTLNGTTIIAYRGSDGLAPSWLGGTVPSDFPQ